MSRNHNRKLKIGDCFEAAFKFAIGNSPMRPEMRIVHAQVTGNAGPNAGGTFTHAWVELRGLVIDPSNFRDFTFVADREKFYETGKVKEVRSYSLEEAITNAVESESYGPWEDRIGDITSKNGKKFEVK